MHSSPEIDQVAAALVEAYKAFPAIVKDKWNPHFSSHFADLASIRSAIQPALSANGLFILQAPNAVKEVVTVTTRILHKSGQFLQSPFSAEARNGSAQAVGAAVTFLCRYGLVSMLGLALADDDDGNSTQKDGEPPPESIPPPAGDTPELFDFQTGQHALAAELKRRNIPEAKWEAIGRWLHGKDKKLLSRAIVSV